MSYSMRGMRGGWVAIATCDGSGCAARLEQAGGTEAEAAVSLTYAAHEAGWNNDTFPRGLYCPACKVSMAGAFAADRLAAAEALARGAQYREREALATVGVLRAREDARAEWDAHHDVLAASVGALDGVGAAGDLAALARREAGPVMRRQWRACARCGREHWLADGEAVPGHGVTVDGVDRDCGTKGEGR